jgi:hypothetical protein
MMIPFLRFHRQKRAGSFFDQCNRVQNDAGTCGNQRHISDTLIAILFAPAARLTRGT